MRGDEGATGDRMTTMTAEQYFKLICKPHFKEFADDPIFLWRAWSAAAALYHFVDYLAHERGMEVEKARVKIQRTFPALEKLRDVTNAFKHCEVERGSSSRRNLRADHSRVGKGAAFSDGTYFSDGTSFLEIPDVVRVEFKGEIIDVLSLCRQTLERWAKHLTGEQPLL
jgi:hypothetical protein